jgi:16S rRNA C967 or C1407 C5-methylase (RsmB/RsmF family)
VLRDEGEDVMGAFLAEHPEFRVHGEPMRTWPHRDDCDGFFACVLDRTGVR